LYKSPFFKLCSIKQKFLKFYVYFEKALSKKLLKYLDSRFKKKFLNRLNRSIFTIFSLFFEEIININIDNIDNKIN